MSSSNQNLPLLNLTTGATQAPTPEPSWSIKKADACELLRAQRRESIDLIFTDPAYASLEKHRNHGTTVRLKSWFPVFPDARWIEFFTVCWWALKPNAHLYVMCDQDTMWSIRPASELCGFRWWKFIPWDKERIGMGYHYRAQHELVIGMGRVEEQPPPVTAADLESWCIAFMEKGERRLNDLGIGDVVRVPSVRVIEHGCVCPRAPDADKPLICPICGLQARPYPTEKPVELAEIFINQSSNPGDVVLDPFCGSGSTGAAALKNGRRFIGGDVSEPAITIATSRLRRCENKER